MKNLKIENLIGIMMLGLSILVKMFVVGAVVQTLLLIKADGAGGTIISVLPSWDKLVIAIIWTGFLSLALVTLVIVVGCVILHLINKNFSVKKYLSKSILTIWTIGIDDMTVQIENK